MNANDEAGWWALHKQVVSLLLHAQPPITERSAEREAWINNREAALIALARVERQRAASPMPAETAGLRQKIIDALGWFEEPGLSANRLADAVMPVIASIIQERDALADDMDKLIADRETMRARLAALEAAFKWRPIESAPRDGTHFLAAQFDGGAGFGWINGRHQAMQAVVHWFQDGFYTSVNEIAPERPFVATHWRPLDEIPVTALRGQGGEG